MKLKMLLAVIAFAMLPGMAMAACGWERGQSASQCPQGQVWDAEAQACASPVTG